MDTSQMACKNRLSKDTYVAVDVKKKKIVSLEVTTEEVHDSKMLKKMVDNASKNNVVKRVLWLIVHMTVRYTDGWQNLYFHPSRECLKNMCVC